jgi:Putative beta-barrel porin 2
MTVTWRSAVVTALFIAASRHLAGAQTPGPDPLEQATIRMGSVGLNPSFVVRDLGVDNNVFNDAEHPKSDFTFTMTPRAEILFSPRRLRIAAVTAIDYVYFEKYVSERGTNLNSQIRVNVDLGRLQPFVSVGGVNTRERYNYEVDTRARHRDRTYAAGLTVRIASRTTLSGAARRTTTDFDQGTEFRSEDLAQAFNGRLDAFEGSVGLQLTPITSVSLVVSHEQQRFDLSPDRDSNTTRITPTVTFSPEGLLNGSVAVGYRHFNGVSPTLVDFSGFVALVNVGVTILGRHRLETTFARDLRYSYEQSAPYYLSTGGTVTLTTQLGGAFDAKATGTRQLLDYSHATNSIAVADDTYTAYGGGIGYRLRQRLRIGLNAEWSHRRSDVASDRQFNNNRVFCTLTWGTPQ